MQNKKISIGRKCNKRVEIKDKKDPNCVSAKEAQKSYNKTKDRSRKRRAESDKRIKARNESFL